MIKENQKYLNRSQIILDLGLIVISMAICGVFWSKSTPQVFAEEITTEQPDFDINEGGYYSHKIGWNRGLLFVPSNY